MIFKDRAKETTTATGSSNLACGGASSGYQALPASGDFYYCITHTSANEWEVGVGYMSTGDLVRDTVLDGSTGPTPVNFSAGSKDVFCVFPATLAASVAAAAAAAKPTGSAEDITTDDTPTPVTVPLAPEPPSVGGIQFAFVRYAVVAYNPSGSLTKAWEGTVVYVDGVGSTDTPTVIHDPATTGWAMSAAITADELVVTVTGATATTIYWTITASVDVARESGV